MADYNQYYQVAKLRWNQICAGGFSHGKRNEISPCLNRETCVHISALDIYKLTVCASATKSNKIVHYIRRAPDAFNGNILLI